MFAQSTSQDNIIHQMRTSNVDSVIVVKNVKA